MPLEKIVRVSDCEFLVGVGCGCDDEGGDDGFKDETDDGEECDRDQLTHSVVLLRAEASVVPRVFLFRWYPLGVCHLLVSK